MARAVSWVMVAAVLCAVYLASCQATDAKAPPLKYAQSREVMWVTIDLEYVDESTVKIDFKDDGHVAFSGDAVMDGERTRYELNVKLFKSILAAESTFRVTNRNIELTIKKAKADRKHWPRLLADEKQDSKLSKIGLIKRDWLRYKDEGDL
eukprot:tig00021127_g18713.t1